MLQYEELRLALLEQETPLKELREALSIDSVKEEIAEYEKQTADEAFWNDVANSNKVLQKLSALRNKVKKYEDLVADYDDTLTLIEMSD
ncbi:MAG: peptide chain release factor 2, partial [Clostridia bacterium]|nr:peptide chain release factor 2 [Clostridia bacterium]